MVQVVSSPCDTLIDTTTAADVVQWVCKPALLFTPDAPQLPFFDRFVDSLSALIKPWQERAQCYVTLGRIDDLSTQLRTAPTAQRNARFARVAEQLTREFTPTERERIWHTLSEHYFFTGQITVEPAPYLKKRRALGDCIENFHFDAHCVASEAPNPYDAEWLTALLSLEPQEITEHVNERVLARLFQGSQLTFVHHQPTAVSIYQGRVPRDDGSDYQLTIELLDGYDLPPEQFALLAQWVRTFNRCLNGHEVERVILEQTPRPDPNDSSYTSSYYDPNTHDVYVRIQPQVVLDSLTHEFGHAIDIRNTKAWRTLIPDEKMCQQWPPKDGALAGLDAVAGALPEDIALPEAGAELWAAPRDADYAAQRACNGLRLNKKLWQLYVDTKAIGALEYFRDAYFTVPNVNNIHHHLLRRGHPSDGDDEVKATLFSDAIRYPDAMQSALWSPGMARSNQFALGQLWRWEQTWLGEVCPMFPVETIGLTAGAPRPIFAHFPDISSAGFLRADRHGVTIMDDVGRRIFFRRSTTTAMPHFEQEIAWNPDAGALPQQFRHNAIEDFAQYKILPENFAQNPLR